MDTTELVKITIAVATPQLQRFVNAWMQRMGDTKRWMTVDEAGTVLNCADGASQIRTALLDKTDDVSNLYPVVTSVKEALGADALTITFERHPPRNRPAYTPLKLLAANDTKNSLLDGRIRFDAAPINLYDLALDVSKAGASDLTAVISRGSIHSLVLSLKQDDVEEFVEVLVPIEEYATPDAFDASHTPDSVRLHATLFNHIALGTGRPTLAGVRSRIADDLALTCPDAALKCAVFSTVDVKTGELTARMVHQARRTCSITITPVAFGATFCTTP